MSQLNRIALAVAAMMAVPAFAATTVPAAAGTIYGGGATLPAGAYIGNKWLTFSPQHRMNVTSTSAKQLDLTNPADPTSLFGNFTINNPVNTKLWKVSYCATGSGVGRKVLTGINDGTTSCGTYDSSATVTGFNADKPQADFAASDAPLKASEIADFAAKPTGSTRASTRTAPVQLPAVAGAIGIIYNNADLGNIALNLTESQICQIFAGQITDWNQLNSSLPHKTIQPVVRNDDSGTTFGFTNHLSAVCPTAEPVNVKVFTTNSTFASNYYNGGTLPTATINSAATKGNGGVVATVLATDGSIGYAEINDGRARAALNGGSLLRYATVSIKPDVAAWSEVVPQNNADGTPKMKNGVRVTKTVKHKAEKYKKFDPLKDLPTSIALSATSDTLLNTVDTVVGSLTAGRYSLTTLTVNGANKGCLQLVAPDAYAKPAIDTKKNDYKQYPIVAVSYLMGYNTGNADTGAVDTQGNPVLDTDRAAAVRALFKAPYTISSKVKTIGKKTGFAALSLSFDGDAQVTGTTAAEKAASLVDRCITN